MHRIWNTLLIAGIIGIAASQPTTGKAHSLTGEQIKNLISNRTVSLSTPFGLSLPLFYNSNGTVSGDISGFSLASAFAPKEQGRWWIDGNTMCQQWPTWYKGRRFCFRISKISDNKIQWQRDDGATGTAVVQR
ncbi:hypothetical protein WJT86_02685 [Microvirga sp. W0021]|uniref:Uncharacterized protein n=1 Tax=Hohaiivirga grylli TaxID=3133970 RepID=A0ABV0BGZ8_9HYPH